MSNSESYITGSIKPRRNKFSLGEDIEIILSIKNTSAQKIYVFIPNHRSEGIEVDIRPSNGNDLKRLEEEPGASLMGENQIMPGQIIEEKLSLNKWATFLLPNKYTVKLTIPIEIYLFGIKEKKDRKGSSETIISEFDIVIDP